jgi:hypothetical protein
MTIEGSASARHSERPARRAPGDWRIDARTKRTGLRGVAAARAALESTRRAVGDDARSDAA